MDQWHFISLYIRFDYNLINYRGFVPPLDVKPDHDNCSGAENNEELGRVSGGNATRHNRASLGGMYAD